MFWIWYFCVSSKQLMIGWVVSLVLLICISEHDNVFFFFYPFERQGNFVGAKFGIYRSKYFYIQVNELSGLCV